VSVYKSCYVLNLKMVYDYDFRKKQKKTCYMLYQSAFLYYFVFNRRKKLIQVWNNLRMSNDKMFIFEWHS